MAEASSSSSRSGSRLLARWRAVPVESRITAVVILVLMAGSVVHQQIPRLAEWFIEDSAITFAYARNLAEGEGLVPWVGGERVEGFSNPTWTYVLAFLHLFGADPFAAAKVLGGVFGALTVPLTWLIAREALPRSNWGVPLLAALAFSVSSQAAIWATSGLENSLFNVLLAAALWRTLVEQRKGGWPFGAFFYFLLAITRPEGIMYAAIGGFWFMIWTGKDTRSATPTLKWLGTFWVPFLGYHAWRYSYFAWELPNTYYAKDRNHNMQNWERFRGWKQLRHWGHEVGHAYFMPLYVLAVTTLRGARGVLGVLLVVASMVWLTWPGAEWMTELAWWPELPAPTWWDKSKPWVVLVTVLLVPPLGLGAVAGWRARMICWWSLCATIFFAVWSSGDWMKGYRWFSLLAVPLSVLFAVGVDELAQLAQRWLSKRTGRWSIPAVVVSLLFGAAIVPPNVMYTEHWRKKRETGPFAIKRRVEYMTSVAEKLWIDEPIVNWDVDQGAHLYWSDFQMMDMAGLIDVSVAHHRYERPFMREHLFAEGRPHFAHVHGGWANTTRIPTYREWRQDYVEIPGYGGGRRKHQGNHVRRDLLLTTDWEGPRNEIAFEEGITFVGFDLPSPETSRARAWWIEVALQAAEREEDDTFRVLMFLSDGEHLQTWELPPGYDWVAPHEWNEDEVFYGRYAPELNKPLTPGKYDLGFVIIGPDGVVPPARDAEGDFVKVSDEAIVGGTEGHPARYAPGEVRFPDAFTIVTVGDNATNAREDREQAYAAAQKGRCERAERWWWKARMHRPKNGKWWAKFGPGVQDALAACWVQKAADDPEREVAHLERARRWNHRHPAYLAAREPVADALYTRALAAREAEDWELAYELFTDTLRVDPQRSWARRYAEEARDHRLGLDPETKEKRRRKARKRREELEERRSKMKGDLKAPRGKAKAGKADAETPRTKAKAGKADPKTPRTKAKAGKADQGEPEE